ncbi:MAG: helicase, partial [Thiohalocapsa sp.]
VSRPGDPDPSATPRVGSDSGADGISLPAAVIQALTEQLGPGNGSHVHVLDQSALKTLAKQHGLGVYTLRERLLTDPRFHEDAHRRLAVSL